MSMATLKLHCFGNQWSGWYDIMKSEFNMSNYDVFSEIQNEFKELNSKLKACNVEYNSLKTALIPPDRKKYFDFIFLYDYSNCEDSFLGELVFKKIFKSFENDIFKETKTSIFSGDLLSDRNGKIIDYLNKYSKQKIELDDRDYFIVLMSHLTKNQSKYINNLFENDKYYVNCLNISLKNDLLKLSMLLPSVGLKIKDKFIMPIPEEDGENIISKFLPPNLKSVFIVNYLFDAFLTYNYQTNIYRGNKDFTDYILNPYTAENFTKYSLIVEEMKFNKYLIPQKPHISKLLCGEQANDIEIFKNIVKSSLSNNIFDIELNKYGAKFRTLIDINDERLFFVFQYIAEKKEIRLITAY